MKGGMFGAGPVHTNGTRQFWKPGNGSKAEVATGKAALLEDLLAMPDFASAPCTEPGVDPEVFFPIGTVTDSGTDPVKDASAYCGRCDQADECLLWALDTSQPAGVWGGVRLDGMHAKTRRELRSRTRLQMERKRSA